MQCCCLSCVGCETGQAIDCWWAVEAQFLSCLYCCNCCWSTCAPFCISCSMCDFSTGLSNCFTGIKYCIFSCGLCCVGPCDGLINCFNIIKNVCSGSPVTGFRDITANTHFLSDKVKDALSLYTGNEPLNSMDKFTP
jgi:hypothetical protein